MYMTGHETRMMGVPKPKIIGETNEQLITPEALLAGTAKQNIETIVDICSLTDDFDGWLYWQVINAYKHNICTTNRNIDAGELLHKECYICSSRYTWNEQALPANDMYGLNYSKIPMRFKDNSIGNSNHTRLKKPIAEYIHNNGWFYTTSCGVNDAAGALINHVPDKEHEKEINDNFTRKLFIQWFNRYVIKYYFDKDKQTIELPHKETPTLFMRLAFMRSFLTDTIENLLRENGWSYEWVNQNSVTIKPRKTVEKDTDDVKLYSPKNMPNFVHQAEQELLKDFTVWFNQEVQKAYLAKYNHERRLYDTIVVTNEHVNINLKKVPAKFTEFTHDGTTLKPIIMQYLLDNDWQYEVTTNKCLQLNL